MHIFTIRTDGNTCSIESINTTLIMVKTTTYRIIPWLGFGKFPQKKKITDTSVMCFTRITVLIFFINFFFFNFLSFIFMSISHFLPIGIQLEMMYTGHLQNTPIVTCFICHKGFVTKAWTPNSSTMNFVPNIYPRKLAPKHLPSKVCFKIYRHIFTSK